MNRLSAQATPSGPLADPFANWPNGDLLLQALERRLDAAAPRPGS